MSVPIATQMPGIPQWGAAAADGGLWIASYDSHQKVTHFSKFDSTGTFSQGGEISGPISNMAICGGSIAYTTRNSVLLGDFAGGSYRNRAQVSMKIEPWTLLVGLGDHTAALMDQ